MNIQATPTFIALALLTTLAITSTVNTIFAQNMTGNMTAGNMTSGNMTETNQTGSVSGIKIHCGGTCLTEDN